MRLYLGTHKVGWLARANGPLFITRRSFFDGGRPRKTLPKAIVPWVLDSGGFMDLKTYGRWSVTVDAYADEIRRYREEIGLLQWAAPMDWMCEENVLAMTGLDVLGHQLRTLDNFETLRHELGGIIAPVLQGWTVSDYRRHAAMYEALGVDLAGEPVVGVGSICRREEDDEIHYILRQLADLGLRIHAFGVRAPALVGTADVVASADSLSWSLDARYAAARGELPDHPHARGGRSCSNCIVYAERWRERVLGDLAETLLYEGEAA